MPKAVIHHSHINHYQQDKVANASDTAVKLFTKVAFEDFASVLRSPYEMILTAIEYVGSGFISAHAIYSLIYW